MSWTFNADASVAGGVSASKIPSGARLAADGSAVVAEDDSVVLLHPCAGHMVANVMTNTGNTDNKEHHCKPDEEFWVFGYGSLVWKVDFPVVYEKKGFIKGFRRRFYQHSIDHRGTPEKPGRVVTLIPSQDDPSARVYGMAYRIADADKERVIQHLDFREKNGYVRTDVDFFAFPEPHTDAAPFRRLCIYVATAHNASFAGELPVGQLAEQVLDACGPSGSNVEYVLQLADAIRRLFPGEWDEHLFGLETEVRRGLRERGVAAATETME